MADYSEPDRVRQDPGRRFVRLAVVIAVVGWLAIAGFEFAPVIRQTLPLSPRAAPQPPLVSAVATAPTPNGDQTPAAGASISIFSVVPDSLGDRGTVALAGMNSTDNPYVVDVFDGTTNSTGVVSGRLSSLFPVIQSEWQSIITPLTSQVSLLVQGTYAVQDGNVTNVYHYFNDFAYNPRENFTSIQLTVPFNTAHPSDVIASNATLTLACVSGVDNCLCIDGHCCPVYSEYVWDTENYTTLTGPFPLVMGNDSSPHLINDSLSVAGTYIYSKLQFGFNSAESVQSSSGNIGFYMSSTVSYNSSTETLQAAQASAAANPQPSDSAAMVFLQNVTLSVLNQKEYLENFGFGENFACVMTSDTYVESASWFGVSNIASTSFAFHGESPNSGWMGLVEHFLHMEYIPSYSNYSLGPTNSVEYLSAAYNATGYTNTANALHQAAAWASYFTAALGLALVVMDAANVCGIFCGLGDIAATTSALSAIAGFTTAFVSAISSISISVVDTLSIQAYSFTNDPHNNTWSSYNMFFEMATNSTTLSGVSGNYVANMPILLGIACPPGDYPGHGC